MATWGGIRAWTNESYANVSDMERVFGNLEFLMERTKSVTVSAPDKARAVELKSVAINDISKVNVPCFCTVRKIIKFVNTLDARQE